MPRAKMNPSTQQSRRDHPRVAPNAAQNTMAVPPDAALYINRELSLLAFFQRVMEEAQDEANPLLERVKFLSIFASNLAEFFMVRVAGLKQQIAAGVGELSPDGLTPAQQLATIRPMVAKLMEEERACLHTILTQLAAAGIRVVDYNTLDKERQARAKAYFERIVFPVLTPLAFDPGRPFPHISNMSLNLSVVVRDGDGNEQFARVKVPNTLPRLLSLDPIPNESREHQFTWLEQVILANLSPLFPGMEIVEAHPFRITRDAEMVIQELEAEDLLETIEQGVRQRRFASVVRVTVDPPMPTATRDLLTENLLVEPGDVYTVASPLGISDVMDLYGLDRPDLKDPPFVPLRLGIFDEYDGDIFAQIRRQDILLHHPYDSFHPVIDFLWRAARDPNVLAIKQSLYRVGRNSPVVEALLEAARNGKQVAVLIELKARFDEESNIEWAKALEHEGVHVVYGLPGLKTHSKIALVVRQENGGIRRYVHLSTGNYNPTTAQVYTDLGLFTCDEAIGADATDVFNYLTGYSRKPDYRKFLVAPINLRSSMERLIRREIEHQKQGNQGHLIFKLNALVDKAMIDLLYEASRAGVQVDLLVRGICCLRPGLPGTSENIRVQSIVGRFLEHSRICYFRNGGETEIYSGSADLMPRNLDRRVEILFPIQDARLIRHVRDTVLLTYLADNVKARQMRPDGTYERVRPEAGQPAVNSQAVLLKTKNTIV